MESTSTTPPAGAEEAGRLPTFLVIGAPKAGTTAAYRYLGEHPEIGVSSRKEIRYFGNDDGKTSRKANNLEEYRRHFQPVRGEKAWGEASPQYLHWSADAAEQMRAALPEVKLLAFLRDPADRAYSQYTFFYRSSIKDLDRASIREMHQQGVDDLSGPAGFSKAIRALPQPIPACGPFPEEVSRLGLRESFYSQDLENYLRHFDRKQIRVYRYDDLTADPVGTMQDVYGFLGVDPSFTPETGKKYNETRVPRSRRLDEWLHETQRLNKFTGVLPGRPRRAVERRVRRLTTKVAYEPLDPADRRVLIDIFREDIHRSGELLGMDLGSWLTVKQ
ncbi:MAG: sulfotransferase [Acidimicrobiia bacterium]|nr:sulfotransferase [Acidimicrobiia bacterium]